MSVAASPPPPPPAGLDWCLFLDVDGTLVELTDTPSQTFADEAIKTLLAQVMQRLDGALALVSGREIATLDALFAPLRLPAAGLHGVERRTAAGELRLSGASEAALDAVRGRLRDLVAGHPGTLLEDKGRTIAIHFRLAPEAQAAVQQGIMAIAAPLFATHHVQEGNMLFELKPRAVNKATAVDAFLEEAPFAGRRPAFVGDDLTDLDGFVMAEARGGISIGVGPRVRGQYHLPNVAAVRAWLQALAELPRPTR